ncbi:hypothetical protein [Geodermatophilus sp. SYSU D01119]
MEPVDTEPGNPRVETASASPLAWEDYRSHVEALLEHEEDLGILRRAADALAQERRAECESDRDALLAQLHDEQRRLEQWVTAADQRAAFVEDQSGGRPAMSLRPGVGGDVLPFRLTDGPRVSTDDIAGRVQTSVQAVDAAIAALRLARLEDASAERMAAWRRRRRFGLARDAVVLPLTFGAALVFYVVLYWSSDGVGPFNATVWTAFAAGVVAAIVAATRSWVFARLAKTDAVGLGEQRQGGALEALLLAWGLSLVLYGPAPRPFRDGGEEFLLGWLDSALVVLAPIAGLVMWGFALRNVKLLFNDAPSVVPAGGAA